MLRTLFAISDIHLEFGVDTITLLEKMPAADILVLAGDIGNATKGLETIRDFLLTLKEKYSDVIFIAGNHEYYQCDYDRDKVIENLREIATETKTHFLQRETKVIQGIEFIGTTMWSLIDKYAYESINDSRQNIFPTMIDYIGEFVDDFRFLRETLKLPSQYPRVVITHHLPTHRLIHPKFSGNRINSGFYSNILDNLHVHGVKYWFSGHSHEYSKCTYGDMQCIVNPVGYPGEQRVSQLSLETRSI